jgi:hypothetical protein
VEAHILRKARSGRFVALCSYDPVGASTGFSKGLDRRPGAKISRKRMMTICACRAILLPRPPCPRLPRRATDQFSRAGKRLRESAPCGLSMAIFAESAKKLF